MKLIRGYKFFGAQVVCAALLSALFFSHLYPCHEYVGYNTGSVTMGYDICDDSPYLTVKAEYHGLMSVVFFHLLNTKTALLRIFAHSIFHPPRA
jgi:hypothetical protein